MSSHSRDVLTVMTIMSIYYGIYGWSRVSMVFGFISSVLRMTAFAPTICQLVDWLIDFHITSE